MTILADGQGSASFVGRARSMSQALCDLLEVMRRMITIL